MTGDTKLDPFKPQQPIIPGVPPKVESADTGRQRSPGHPGSKLPGAAWASFHSVWLGIGVFVIVAIVAIAWWVHTSTKKQSIEPQTSQELASPPQVLKAAKKLPVGPGEIAHGTELAKTWSAKRFLFRDPMTSDETEALAVRLPGGGLWGISLRDSYGTCELEYITNLETLRSQYNFRAEHPVVVNPCTQAIFDLAVYGRGPHGLVRGEIVRGHAARPPIGIELVERGDRILAVRME